MAKGAEKTNIATTRNSRNTTGFTETLRESDIIRALFPGYSRGITVYPTF